MFGLNRFSKDAFSPAVLMKNHGSEALRHARARTRRSNPPRRLGLADHRLARETNGFGDIFGGWLVSQMDLAGTAMASKVAGGRVATVAIDRMAFLVPVAVGAQLSFYTQALEIGRSSIQMMVEVWSDDPLSSEWRKVTEAVFVFVAIDGSGRTRSVPPRR